MASTAAPARASGHEPLLSIGQVLARLQPEFPDLTPVEAAVPRGAAARHAGAHRVGLPQVLAGRHGALRFVLSMQRDHYLPLKVIRGYLEAIDAGRDARAARGPTSAAVDSSRAPAHAPRRAHRGSRRNAMLLDDAVSASLHRPAAEHFGDDALAVLRVARRAARSGIEPRHLRGFRAAAEREAALIETRHRPVEAHRCSRQGARRRAGPRDRRAARDRALERRSRDAFTTRTLIGRHAVTFGPMCLADADVVGTVGEHADGEPA